MRRPAPVLVLLLATLSLASCDAIKGIFKAGFVVGIVLAILVVAIVLWIVSKGRG